MSPEQDEFYRDVSLSPEQCTCYRYMYMYMHPSLYMYM